MLVVLVTLVCWYAACWGPTKEWATRDVLDHTDGNPRKWKWDKRRWRMKRVNGGYELYTDPCARLPLIVELAVVVETDTRTSGAYHYYFWFFGYVAKLPYERDI